MVGHQITACIKNRIIYRQPMFVELSFKDFKHTKMDLFLKKGLFISRYSFRMYFAS